MKKLMVWLYFYLGMFWAKMFEWTSLEMFYDAYNRFMAYSVNLQDEWGIEDGPWVSPEEEQKGLNSSDKM